MKYDCICICIVYSVQMYLFNIQWGSFSVFRIIMNTNIIMPAWPKSLSHAYIRSVENCSMYFFMLISDSTIFSEWIFSWARNTHTELHIITFKEPLTTNHIKINNNQKHMHTHKIDTKSIFVNRLDAVFFEDKICVWIQVKFIVYQIHRNNIYESRYG